MWKCRRCGSELSDEYVQCPTCGEMQDTAEAAPAPPRTLGERLIESAGFAARAEMGVPETPDPAYGDGHAPVQESDRGIQASPENQGRYPALRFVSVAYKALAVLVAVGLFFWGFWSAVENDGGFLTFVVACFGGAIGGIGLYALGEFIQLQMDMQADVRTLTIQNMDKADRTDKAPTEASSAPEQQSKVW